MILKSNKYLLWVGVITFFVISERDLQAQTAQDFLSVKSFTPPSPESAALAKYGDIPVDNSTGAIAVEIPIYQIQSRQLTLPISLSYHSSGIKVEEYSTPVGLGWVVNAGGTISRTVVGWADEKSVGCLNLSAFKNRTVMEGVRYSPSGSGELTRLFNLSYGEWDTQSDIYNFNAPELTGKFVYDTSREIQYLPTDRQILISRNPSNYFQLTDDRGIKYEFKEPEKTERYNSVDTTSWHLTKMISADKTDTIYFEYVIGDTLNDYETAYGFNVYVPKAIGTTLCDIQSPEFGTVDETSYFVYHRKLLKRIKFSSGYVEFNYNNDRLDPIKDRLDNIKIYSYEDSLVKQVYLRQSYFISPDKYTADTSYSYRLRLDQVVFPGKDSLEEYSYKLKYDTNVLLPSYRWSIYGKRNIQQDYWGYFNGCDQYGTETLLPEGFESYLTGFYNTYYYGNSAILSTYQSRESNRDVNPLFTGACMLKQIQYPSGGVSNFVYENNKTGMNGNNKDFVGGLRIKSVSTVDSVGKVENKKIYNYSLGTAITWVVPHNFYFRKQQIHWISGSAYCYSESFHVKSNPITAINYYNGSPVFYDEVSIINSNDSSTGKTVYRYEYETDSIPGVSYLNKYWNFSSDKSWARGQPVEESIYERRDTGFRLIKKIQYEYQALGRKVVKVGQICDQVTNDNQFSLMNYLDAVYLNPTSYGYDQLEYLTHFEYADVYLSLGSKKLKRSIETFFDGDTITISNTFFYEGDGHLYPTRQSLVTSTGDTSVLQMKYVQDRSSLSGLTSDAYEALDSMYSKNVLNVVIERSKFMSGNLLFSERTDYLNWNNPKHFYPQFVQFRQGGNSFEKRIEYLSYNSFGNLCGFRKPKDVTKSYLWNYRNSYVVAEIVNGDSASVAYTSFEGDNNGGWSYSGSLNSVYKVSGNKGYLLSGGDITRQDLPQAYYIISYWGKSGSASVNNSGPTRVGVTVGDWTYYEHVISGTSATVSGSVYIDDLRLYPKNAVMTTYTYNPLIGMTSESDASGHLIYYEYDSYNRLKVVKDMNGNILKRVSYKHLSSFSD